MSFDAIGCYLQVLQEGGFASKRSSIDTVKRYIERTFPRQRINARLLSFCFDPREGTGAGSPFPQQLDCFPHRFCSFAVHQIGADVRDFVAFGVVFGSFVARDRQAHQPVDTCSWAPP